jgi:hypothetical protein
VCWLSTPPTTVWQWVVFRIEDNGSKGAPFAGESQAAFIDGYFLFTVKGIGFCLLGMLKSSVADDDSTPATRRKE